MKHITSDEMRKRKVPMAPNLTGAQLRAARALLGISAVELAEMAGIGVATIRRYEVSDGPVGMTMSNAQRLIDTLRSAGVLILYQDGYGGEGVRRKGL